MQEDYYKMIETNSEYDYYNIPEPASGDTIINKGITINNSGGLWKYSAYNQIKWKLMKLKHIRIK